MTTPNSNIGLSSPELLVSAQEGQRRPDVAAHPQPAAG